VIAGIAEGLVRVFAGTLPLATISCLRWACATGVVSREIGGNPP
jgi:hypothetical protein